MAFSSGVFSRLYNWTVDKANAVKIRADRMDAEFDGIATALSTCILKDGTQTLTASIPWNSQNLTGVGNLTVTGSTVSSSTSTGAAVITGGVGVGGALNVGGTLTSGTFATTTKPGTEWGLDFTPAGKTTLANNATYDLAVGSGLVSVVDNNGAAQGLVWCMYGTATVITGTSVSGTLDTSGKINVYYNAGLVRIQNKLGSEVDVFISAIKMRGAAG